MWFNSMKGNECSIDKRTLLLHNQIKYTGDLDKCGMCMIQLTCCNHTVEA